MANELLISPSYAEEGMAISVSVPNALAIEHPHIYVSGPLALEVQLKPFDKEYFQSQFALFQAGTYQVSIGSIKKEIQIHPKSSLPFLSEFGTLASSVIFFLGGLILWSMKRKKKRRVGSF